MRTADPAKPATISALTRTSPGPAAASVSVISEAISRLRKHHTRHLELSCRALPWRASKPRKLKLLASRPGTRRTPSAGARLRPRPARSRLQPSGSSSPLRAPAGSAWRCWPGVRRATACRRAPAGVQHLGHHGDRLQVHHHVVLERRAQSPQDAVARGFGPGARAPPTGTASDVRASGPPCSAVSAMAGLRCRVDHCRRHC